jgi:DNA-binding NarL/FixJ family response regulator
MDTATGKRSVPLPILLVDDYAPFRIAIRQLLERYREFTVVGEACDGSAALELALTLIPQVVIMDVHMPRLGGVEATRRLKRMLPDLYVIGVSSNDDADTQTAMKAAGSSAFLSKNCTHQLPRLIALLTGRLVPVIISPEAEPVYACHDRRLA